MFFQLQNHEEKMHQKMLWMLHVHVGEECFFQFFPNSQSNKFLSIMRPLFLIGYCFKINRSKLAWPTTLDETCWDTLQKYLLFLSSFLVYSCVKTCLYLFVCFLFRTRVFYWTWNSWVDWMVSTRYKCKALFSCLKTLFFWQKKLP